MNKFVDQIKRYTDLLSPVVFDEVDSTNEVAKRLAAEGANEGTAVIAETQTKGRGRMGRSFYSPKGGLYMSIILRPRISPKQTLFITAAAAVAAAIAIEKTFPRKTKIKWVNDIYINGKKVCGILAEGGLNAKTNLLEYVILGVGINLCRPEGNFPDNIPLADSITEKREVSYDLKAELIANFANEFFKFYKALDKKEFMRIYKEKSFLDGKRVSFERDGQIHTARVVGVDDEARLIVCDSGIEYSLSYGDVQLTKS